MAAAAAAAAAAATVAAAATTAAAAATTVAATDTALMCASISSLATISCGLFCGDCLVMRGLVFLRNVWTSCRPLRRTWPMVVRLVGWRILDSVISNLITDRYIPLVRIIAIIA